MRSATILVALAIAGAAACGRKGPPLTPIVRVPAAAGLAEPRRVGNDTFVTVTIPRQNIDNSSPASVSRVDVYGATSLTPPTRARFLEIATLVATIPVSPAADPEDPTLPVAPPPPDAAAQGDTVVVRDPLTADDLVPRELVVLEEERRRAPSPGTPVAPPVTALRRFYLAIPFNERGRSGPLSPIVELPLFALPDPPTRLAFSTTATSLTLQWEPSGGLLGWLMDKALAQEQPPFPETLRPAIAAPVAGAAQPELPSGPTLYNVYREIAPDPLILPEETPTRIWLTAAPRPLNLAPQPALSFTDPLEVDGRERCYEVRAVRGAFESVPSERLCVTPIDTTPPAAPAGLAAIVTEGAINLIWEPNVEEDLGGYVVLRRDAADATLLQLTPTPISDSRYTDRSVTPGARYTYQVRAVDTRIPLPNVSAAAELVETAR